MATNGPTTAEAEAKAKKDPSGGEELLYYKVLKGRIKGVCNWMHT